VCWAPDHTYWVIGGGGSRQPGACGSAHAGASDLINKSYDAFNVDAPEVDVLCLLVFHVGEHAMQNKKILLRINQDRASKEEATDYISSLIELAEVCQ
jgi:hypothetical protein